MRNLLYMVIVSVLAGLLVCSGCKSAEEREFDRLESIVDSDPDSVVRALEGIRVDSSAPDRVKARHALLKSWALYKDYIDPASDSTVNVAIDYYSHSGDRKRLAKAYFLRGMIYNAAGNTDAALMDYLKAADQLEDEDEPFLRGTVYRSISTLLSSVYSTTESLEYSQKATDAFREYGDSSYVAYQELVTGHVLFLSGDLENAEKYANKVISTAREVSDTNLLDGGLRLILMIENLMQNNDKAYGHYLELMQLPRFVDFSYEEKNFITNVLISHGDTAQASQMLRDAERTMPAAMIPAEAYAHQGRYKEAYETMIAVADSADGILENIMNQKTSLIIKENSESKRIIAENRIRNMRTVSGVIISSLCIVLILLVIIFIMKNSLHRQKEKALMLENDNFILKVKELSRNLMSAMSESEDAKDALHKETENNSNMLRSSYFLLDELCKSYNEDIAKKKLSRNSRNGVKVIIDKFKVGGEYLMALEKYVNGKTDSAVSEIRAGGISEEEIQIILLSIVGVSPSAISFINDVETSLIYNRKSRLKGKLRNMGAPGQTLLSLF